MADGGSNPVLDIAQKAQETQQSTADVTSAAQNVITQLKPSADAYLNLSDQANTARARSDTAVNAVLSQVPAAKQEISTAYDNIVRTQKLPGFVSSVLSIFDSDYSPDVQKTKIQAAASALELTKQNATAATDLTTSTQRAAELARTNLLTGLQAGREAAVTRQADVGTLVSLQNERTRLANEAVAGMTEQQLKAAMANPAAIGNIPGATPGMVEQAYQTRRAGNLALLHAGLIYETGKIQKDAAQLGLSQELIKTGLTNMSTKDFDKYAEQASTQGYANVQVGDHQVKIPDVMFTELAKSRSDRAIARAKEHSDYNTALISNPQLEHEFTDTLGRLGFDINGNKINDTFAASFAGGPELRSAITKANVGATMYKSSQDPGVQMSAYRQMTDAMKDINDLKEKAIAAAPKDAQAGIRQFVETGQINPGTATPTLASSVATSSDSPIAFGNVYRDGDQAMRSAFRTTLQKQAAPLGTIAGQEVNAALKGGNLLDAMTKLKLDHNELFEKTITSPEGKAAKESIVGSLSNSVLHNAVASLAADTPERPGIDAFKKVFHNGDFAAEYKTNGRLDADKVLKAVATSDPGSADLLMGVLNDRSFRDQFTAFDKKVNNSPVHAAYRARLLYNSFDPLFSALVAKTETIKQQAAAEVARRVEDSFTQQGGGAAGGVPVRAPVSGIPANPAATAPLPAPGGYDPAGGLRGNPAELVPPTPKIGPFTPVPAGPASFFPTGGGNDPYYFQKFFGGAPR